MNCIRCGRSGRGLTSDTLLIMFTWRVEIAAILMVATSVRSETWKTWLLQLRITVSGSTLKVGRK
jgi:hypothetical protein